MAAVTNEAAAAAASIEGSATETIEKPLPHKLERKWTFWFDNQSKPNQGAAWGTSLRKIYSFDTVEEFWWYAFHFPFFILILSYNLFAARSASYLFSFQTLLGFFFSRQTGYCLVIS
jgi:hypothetical protein